MINKRKESETDRKDTSLVRKKQEKPEKPDKIEKAKKASRVRFALEQEPKFDMYYYRIYRKLRLLRYICVLLAALFVMSVPMVYSDQITTDNFKYLMKYINLQLSEDAEEYAPFSYEPSQHMDFSIYSEDIVICTETSVVFYDKLGNESLRVTYGPYKNPTMLISDEYVLVYDRGGNEYVICALDNSGRYAVLTSNQNYTSEICVFNRNFKQTNRIQRDLYVSDLFFTDDEGGFGYTAFSTDVTGAQSGEICLYDLQSKKLADVKESAIPLKAVVSQQTVRVLYTDRIVWYDQKGAEQKSYVFSDTPGAYCFVDNGIYIQFTDQSTGSAGYTEFIPDDDAPPIRIPSTDSVLSICCYEDRCYLIGSRSIMMADLNEGKCITLADETPSVKKLLHLPDGKLMICYADKTETIPNNES